MQTNDEVRSRILELSSESEHGSWEFWSNKDEKTEAQREQIAQALVNLVNEKKIFPVEHTSVIDQSYREVPLDVARLKEELSRSMKSNNVDPDSFYWFLATEEGKKEDTETRGK
jgi:hypothetical protein